MKSEAAKRVAKRTSEMSKEILTERKIKINFIIQK